MDQMRGILGMIALMAIAWLLSSHKRQFPFKIVFGGLLLQFALALLVLKTDFGRAFFDGIGAAVNVILTGCDEAAHFVFGPLAGTHPENPYIQWPAVAGIKILTTIIVCSTLSAIGYHYGILQRIVAGMAWAMSRLLGVSGAESLSCAANVFLGQTEAPLLVRPYIPRMTRSELMAVMTGGFATIAMGVMAVYVDVLGTALGHGGDSDANKIAIARHLLTASLMSAPAAFVMAKIMLPEVDRSETSSASTAIVPVETRNGLDAATSGASQGMMLAINVIAMLIAFTALITMINFGLGALDRAYLAPPNPPADYQWLSLQWVLGRVFSPMAWFIGVESADQTRFGELLGTGLTLNEFIAYLNLADMIKDNKISERSVVLLTYSLCGFANVASMGIQIAGIGSIAPTRRLDLVQLAPRAMIGGAMASWMTGCIAGMLTR